jgi:hypothetical protein
MSIQRLHKESVPTSLTFGGQLNHPGSCGKIGDNQRGYQTVNTEFEVFTVLEAFTKHAVVTCKVQKCDSATVI